MKTGIIYCRVSSTKQRDDWDSLKNQETVCREYCKNNWIQLLWVFKETFTGKSSNRPILQEAITNAKLNKINYFIIFDIDRFSREWYSKYTELKNELKNHSITLKDSKHIIWDEKIVMTNSIVDMSEYKWNKENPSEMAEMVFSAQAQIEGKKILQRTIPKEIELEQKWYQVRPANYWYLNKKIQNSDGKVTIQVKCPIKSVWVIEMFKKRAEWNVTDKKIVDDINLKWCLKNDWKKMTIKYFQELIKNPIYAGVRISKWTWNKPIKTPYKWLVDINTWNKANRWKITILEVNKNELSIKYNEMEEENIIPEKEKRKNYNSDYPYWQVLKCPTCWWHLTANKSKSKSWKYHFYYQCKWKNWKRHTNYSIKRDEVNKNILEIFQNLKINDNIINLFEKVSRDVFKDRANEIIDESIWYQNRIKQLQTEENEILNNIDKIINFPALLEKQNSKIEEIRNDVKILKEKSKEENNLNLDNFLHYSINIIQHLDILAWNKEEPDLIQLAFDIVFDGKTEYENILCHTPSNTKIMALNTKKELQLNWNSFNISQWHLH